MYSKDRLYNEFVFSLKAKMQAQDKKIIFLCIGTNNVIGDSFGPLVGSKLKVLLKNNDNAKVIGDMKRPVNGKNIYKIMQILDCKYQDSYIVSIDAAISDFNTVGDIYVTDAGISINSEMSKENMRVGNIGIKACVGNKGNTILQNLEIIRNASKQFIEELSQIVALGIDEVCNYKVL
jgi:putative sporulation protein YyaC